MAGGGGTGAPRPGREGNDSVGAVHVGGRTAFAADEAVAELTESDGGGGRQPSSATPKGMPHPLEHLGLETTAFAVVQVRRNLPPAFLVELAVQV